MPFPRTNSFLVVPEIEKLKNKTSLNLSEKLNSIVFRNVYYYYCFLNIEPRDKLKTDKRCLHITENSYM